jgi:hypothetical protein
MRQVQQTLLVAFNDYTVFSSVEVCTSAWRSGLAVRPRSAFVAGHSRHVERHGGRCTGPCSGYPEHRLPCSRTPDAIPQCRAAPRPAQGAFPEVGRRRVPSLSVHASRVGHSFICSWTGVDLDGAPDSALVKVTLDMGVECTLHVGYSYPAVKAELFVEVRPARSNLCSLAHRPQHLEGICGWSSSDLRAVEARVNEDHTLSRATLVDFARAVSERLRSAAASS